MAISSKTRFKLDGTQALLIAVCMFVNTMFFLAATDSRPYPGGPSLSATYHAAADGQRYWGVALNLVEKQAFTIPPLWDSRVELPLVRSGPLPALLFSIPIKIFGFDRAPFFIVIFQCFLLYLISVFARNLASPFSVNPTLLQILILFNPNLIGLAHVAQSDLMFSFLFSAVLVVAHSMIREPDRIGFRSLMFLGLLFGLLTLTRSVGLIVSIGLPIIFLIVFASIKVNRAFIARRMLPRILAALVVFLLVVFPWSVRNYELFDNFSPIVGSASQLQYNFGRILYAKGMNSPEERDSYESKLINRSLASMNQNRCHQSPSTTSNDNQCNNALRSAYLNAIMEEPLPAIAKSVVSAALRTLLTGGSNRIAQYIGLSDNQAHEALWIRFDGFDTVKEFLTAISTQTGYLVVFIGSTGFTLITRMFGLVGLYISMSGIQKRPFNIFYLLTVFLLLAAYFAVSTSRFRAPLEPILMLYAAVGLSKFLSVLQSRFRKV